MGQTASPWQVQRFLGAWFERHYRACRLRVEEPGQREWMRIELDGTARRPLFYATSEHAAQEAVRRPPLGLFSSLAFYDNAQSARGYSDLRAPEQADVALDIDCKPGLQPDGDAFEGLSDAFLAARRQAQAALGALRRDFRLQDDEVSLRFSGGKGYHLLLTSDRFRRLGKRGREELLACLRGVNVQSSLLFPGMGGLQLPRMPPAGGASRQIWDALQALHSAARLPVTPVRLQRLVEYHAGIHGAAEVLAALKDAASPAEVLQRHPKWWEALVECALHLSGPLVDGAVLMDLRRVIRVPGSINGKTGLLCRTLQLDQLSEFDPFAEANPFAATGTVAVRGLRSAALSVRGETHRVLAGQTASLPPCAAVPLVAQGAACPLT